MDPSNESFDTLVTCGRMTASTRTFNGQTNIEQIREYVCHSFPSSLPQSYRIVYYDTMAMSFVDLEDQLRNEVNPFQMNPSIGVQDIDSMPSSIHLFVVQNSSIQSDIRSQIEIQSNQPTSGVIDENSSSDEIPSELYLSVNSTPTDHNVSQDDNEQNKDPSSIIIRRSIEPLETKNILSNRLIFSLDVKPNQRNIYKSDQFNIRKGESNGRIARVQGIKTPTQKMLQVLPKLRIPPKYRQANVTLLVAVVSEHLNNGMRIWYKHCHKGFLPENYGKDTNAINPIEFDLNKCSLTDDGDFILSLQMITKWNKSQKQLEVFHRLEETKSVLLHSAPHDPDSPRLCCVLRQNGRIDWKTFCLSDFIRSPRTSKRKSSSVNAGRICSPNRKRLKING